MKNTVILLLGLFLAAGIAQAEPIGMVVAVQGSASATDASGATRNLVIQSEILLNDTIQTGPSSRLQILLNDDSLLAQGESSEMTIDEYVYNPAKASDNAFGAKLGKGLFRTVTGKITDLNPDRFKVKTARATIGIRGCDLGYNITEAKDDISIMAIPAGKKIFIDSLVGANSLLIEVPSFVSIDNRGMLQQRDLTGGDRRGMQQGTTPGAGNPDLGPVDLSEVDPGGLVDDLSGGGVVQGGETIIDQGTIIQDTVLPPGGGEFLGP